jgi:hypothetical protein
MKSIGLTLAGRRAAFAAGSASVLLLGSTLAGVVTADPAQASQSAAAPQAIGPHTHQLRGLVKTALARGSTTFVVTTERYGDVSVSFAGSAPKGHGHGAARASGAGGAAGVKTGERVVVRGSTSADGKTFVARRVHVSGAKGVGQHASHVVGSITSVATKNGTTTLTISLADGTSQSVTGSSATKIHPADKTVADLTVASKVTVVQKNGAAKGVVVMTA